MLDTLNDFERSLIQQFSGHALFANLDRLSWDEFLEILIQRRYLSLSIVNIYEFVIDALQDEAIKVTVREILHEEFPRNTKGVPLRSHREMLFRDLTYLGADPHKILLTPASSVTAAVQEESFRLLHRCLDAPNYQARLITVLRFWAEVMVSVEYSKLWVRMCERLSPKQSDQKHRSEFYFFHMIHDDRNSDIGNESFLGGLTHAQELALHLKSLIDSEKTLSHCLELMEEVYFLKMKFYDQFIDP